MKANEFKAIIRALVIEEVQTAVAKEVAKQLPKLLFEMVGQQPRSVVAESRQPVLAKPQSVPQGKPTPPPVPQQQKPQKRYAKDPLLNAILNETTPGLPSTYDQGVPLPDFSKVGVSEEFMGEMRELMTEGSVPEESYTQMPQQMAEEQYVEPTNGPDLNKLFNKNFKAILDKSKAGHGGSFSNVLQSW